MSDLQCYSTQDFYSQKTLDSSHSAENGDNQVSTQTTLCNIGDQDQSHIISLSRKGAFKKQNSFFIDSNEDILRQQGIQEQDQSTKNTHSLFDIESFTDLESEHNFSQQSIQSTLIDSNNNQFIKSLINEGNITHSHNLNQSKIQTQEKERINHFQQFGENQISVEQINQIIRNNQLKIKQYSITNKQFLQNPDQMKVNSEHQINIDDSAQDITNLFQKFQQLNERLEQNQLKLLNIDQYLNNLKIQLQKKISPIDRYSTFWLKRIINNQINKQILMHSLEYQLTISLENNVIIQEINEIEQQIQQSCRINSLKTQIFEQNLIDAQSDELQQDNNNLSLTSISNIQSDSIQPKSIEAITKGDTNPLIPFQQNTIQKQTNFRVNVAFAGLSVDDPTNNLILDNQQLLDDSQTTSIIAFSTAIAMISAKMPIIDLISLGCIGIVQSILNFTNPHRTLSADWREQSIMLSQLTVAGGLGVTGALIGQAIIPIPILGAVVGGLVMEFFGVYLSSKFKDWSEKSIQQKKINFIVQNNAQIKENNINKYYEILDIKKQSLTEKITFPKQHSICQLTGSESHIDLDKYGDIEKLQIYVLFSLQILGFKIFVQHKDCIGEVNFNQAQLLHHQLEAFTEYFDFNYLSIGKKLYQICEKLKGEVSFLDIQMIIDEIHPSEIDGNNFLQQNEEMKKYCKEDRLRYLLKSKNIDDQLIDDFLPKAIKELKSAQKMDLWCTYICLQLINPSFVFLDIFMMKINYQLEQKRIFLIDIQDQYIPIFKEMFTDY